MADPPARKPRPKPKPKPRPKRKRKPAAKPAPPLLALAPPPALDPVADALARQIDEDEKLLAAHKFRHAQLVARRQAGELIQDEAAGSGELLRLMRQEIVIENRKAQLRIRELTRQMLAPCS